MKQSKEKRLRRYLSPNCEIETLAKRIMYGGRKGRSAAQRLGLWGWSGRGKYQPSTKYEACGVLMVNEENQDLPIIKQYINNYRKS